MIKRVEKTIEYFYYVFFVFCTGIFIFELPDAVYWSPVILFAVFILYKLYKKEELNIGITTLIFAVFSAAYIYYNYNPSSDFYYQSFVHIHAILFMIIGYNFFSRENFKSKIKLFEMLMLCISVLSIVYALLTLYYNIKNPPDDLSDRFYHSLWYTEVIKAATGLCMSFAIPSSFGVYYLFNKSIIKKLAGIILIAVSVAANLYTGTRTIVFFLPCLLVFAAALYFVLYKKKYISVAVVLCLFLIVLIASVYIFLTKYDQIEAYVANTPFKRYFITDSSFDMRIIYAENVLKNFSFSYLGGGVNTSQVGMPHNMWLYIYDFGGIVSFLLFIVFTLRVVIEYISFMARKQINFSFKFLISLLLLMIFVEFMTDAFLLPVPSFYIISMFVFGIISGSLHATKKEKTSHANIKNSSDSTKE